MATMVDDLLITGLDFQVSKFLSAFDKIFKLATAAHSTGLKRFSDLT